MAQKRKNSQPEERIIDSGANWKITQKRGERDYWAWIEDRGFIGARPTSTAARSLIMEFNAPEAS
jgi:hypothetical protein